MKTAKANVAAAEAAAAAAHERTRLAREHAREKQAEEAAMVEAVEAAAKAADEAEAAVSAAYKHAQEFKSQLETGRVFMCFAEGCGERFENKAALRKHTARAHRAKWQGAPTSGSKRGKQVKAA